MGGAESEPSTAPGLRREPVTLPHGEALARRPDQPLPAQVVPGTGRDQHLDDGLVPLLDGEVEGGVPVLLHVHARTPVGVDHLQGIAGNNL